LIRVFEYWIEVADFDGFRIDTVKHIDRPEIARNVRGFWGDFTDRMRSKAKALGKQNFFIFGEGFDGNDELIGSYTWGGTDAAGDFGRFDSMFYFSQKYRGVDAVFVQNQPTKNLECLHASRMGRAQDPWCATNGYAAGPTWGPTSHASSENGGIGLAPNQVLVNFLDNHDLPRFLFDKANKDVIVPALIYLMTWDGIPCVYYGTEQLFAGGVDPKNREDMWRGNPEAGYAPFATDHETFALVQGLIAMRKDNVALRRGAVAPVWATTEPGARRDAGIFAFERSTMDQTVLVVINASDQESESCAPANEGGACLRTTLPAGSVLKDVVPGAGATTFTVKADGTVAVTVPAHSGRVLVRQ
jgi:alpha-amylase